MMHHLIKCDQGPQPSSPESVKLSQVSSSSLCQLVTVRDQTGPLSTVLFHNLTPRLRAYWHRQVTKGRASFLLSHNLSNPPLQKSLFMSFLSAPFTFSRQMKKASPPSKTRLLFGWAAVLSECNCKMP